MRRPDASAALSIEPVVESNVNLAGYDGTIDFAGASGHTLAALQVTLEQHVVLQSAADLALFTAASTGDAIALTVDASGTSTATGPGALIVAFGSSASADVSVCYGYREVRQSLSFVASPPTWQQPLPFARHDPALGPLRAVRLRVRTRLAGTFRVESFDPAPGISDARLAATATIVRPSSTVALVGLVEQRFVDPLLAYDGTLDFAGTSGATHTGAAVDAGDAVVLTSPSDLALFTATTPGQTIVLGLIASDASTAQGGALVTSFQPSLGVEVELVYDHASPVAAFCSGDGSGAACPCGNASAPRADEGCLNSLGIGGALRGSGYAEIGADTLVLTASNLPASVAVLFFQGTSALSVPFGDGLRCAGGTVRRLGTIQASGGVATFPPPGASVSAAGGATTGTTLRYQAWYRNAAAFCTSATFNLTNGIAIGW